MYSGHKNTRRKKKVARRMYKTDWHSKVASNKKPRDIQGNSTTLTCSFFKSPKQKCRKGYLASVRV